MGKSYIYMYVLFLFALLWLIFNLVMEISFKIKDNMLDTKSVKIGLLCKLMLFLFTIQYLRGWICYLPLSNPVLNGVYEFAYVLFFVATLFKKESNLNFYVPGWQFLWFCILWTVISGIVNGTGFYVSYLQSRFWFSLYLFMVSVSNSGFSQRELEYSISYVKKLFLLQIPVCIYNYFILGGLEKNVGTVSSGGGSLGTSFPLIIASFGFGYYFFKKQRPLVLFAVLSFGFIGFSNGKRANCVVFPILVAICFMLEPVFKHSVKAFIRNTFVMAMVTPVVMILGLEVLSNMASFGDIKREGDFISKINAAIDIADDYSNEEGTHSGLTQSRGDARRRMWELLKDGYEDSIFGVGPMSSSVYSEFRGLVKYGIGYGAGGWCCDAISIGVPGMVSHILFYLYLFYLLIRRVPFDELNANGKMFKFGSLVSIVSMLFIHFFYADSLCLSLILQMLPICCVTMLLSPNYNQLLRERAVSFAEIPRTPRWRKRKRHSHRTPGQQ